MRTVRATSIWPFSTRGMNSAQPATVSVSLKDIGFDGPCKVRDLWKAQDLGVFSQNFEPLVAPHGAGLYRVSLEK